MLRHLLNAVESCPTERNVVFGKRAWALGVGRLRQLEMYRFACRRAQVWARSAGHVPSTRGSRGAPIHSCYLSVGVLVICCLGEGAVLVGCSFGCASRRLVHIADWPSETFRLVRILCKLPFVARAEVGSAPSLVGGCLSSQHLLVRSAKNSITRGASRIPTESADLHLLFAYM